MAKFTEDEKIQVVIRYQNGTEGVKSIAKSPGIDYSFY
ncbi:transposase [Gracilibacillus dipsosauri]|nr:transposase [Gracilibacillus dipsosauri]